MQPLKIVSCLLIFCGPLIPAEVAGDPSDPEIELLFSLAWGEQDSPQLGKRFNSSATQGPTSVALGPQGKIWILDNQANRLLAYDNSGCLLEVVALILVGMPALILVGMPGPILAGMPPAGCRV